MVNIDKIKELAKSKGISITYICDQFGTARGYLNDVARGKNSMSEERVYKAAQILGTSFEYLMDITDDPDPNFLLRETESLEERIVHEVMYKLAEIPEEHKETLSRLLNLPDEDVEKAMQMLDIMWRK